MACADGRRLGEAAEMGKVRGPARARTETVTEIRRR